MIQPLALAVALAALAPPPETPKKPVTDAFHGVEVSEDYRWLEDGKDPAVQAWSDAQNARTRAFLDGLPDDAAVRARVDALVRSSSVRYLAIQERAGRLFALRWDPKAQQPTLVTLRSAADPASERVVVDPNRMDAAGGVAIDFFAPSLDGRRVAVSLSRGGTESGDVHVFDVATGKDLGDVVPRVNGGTAGGAVAWSADGRGFFYTRYPRGEERPAEDRDFYQQVWFHRLGTPTAQDTYELGKELPRIAEVELFTPRDGSAVLAQVKNGDGGEVGYWVRRAARPGWTRLAAFEDKVVRAALGDDGAVYVVSRQGAPRGRVLRVPLATPALAAAKEVVPQGEGSIEELAVGRERLYVASIEGGPSRLRAYDLAGRPLGDLPIPPVASVGHLARAGASDLLFEVGTYTTPAAWWRYDARTGKASRTALAQTSGASFDDVEVVRETCVSKDGTKVPMSVLRRKGAKLDGAGPALLYGYGGYGVSEVPYFSPVRRVWLDGGGVWAVAHLRGGGEYGEEWHLAGNLTKKQNVFDDFHACALALVEKGYTSPARLAIMGGSNGGLLMGASLTQHPEQFRAVVSAVGLYDALRAELSPNGAFNVTEFGTVKDEAQFRALRAYSPYHHVSEGTKYPAVLLLSGENDPRVEPWHSRKFAARLQAASGSQHPILLRTAKTGHGVGSALDEIIAQRADMYTFLFHELGMKLPAAGSN